MLLRIIVIALVVWVVLAVVGFVVKGLLWLAFVALALFVVTAVVGAVRRRAHGV